MAWWDADDVKWHPNHSRSPYALNSTNRIAGPALRVADPYPDEDTWTPQFEPGMVGQAFSYALSLPLRHKISTSVPSHPDLSFTTTMSVELWVKARPTVWSEFVVLRKAGDVDTLPAAVGTTGYVLYGDTATGRLRWHVGRGAGAFSMAQGATNVLDNRWHHVVATFDMALPTGQMKLYVDGALDGVADAPGPIATNAAPVQLGIAEYWRPLDGALDETRFYNRALAPAEVTDLYVAPLRCRPTFPARAYDIAQIGEPGDIHSSELAIDGDVMAIAKWTRVEVFRRTSGGAWNLEQFIPTWGTDCNLLTRVAVSGNVLAVGKGLQNCIYGGFKIFRFNGTTWVEEFHREDTYGLQKTVAVHGNVVAVASQGYGAIPEARVRIFRHDGTAWSEEATFTGPQGAGSYYGYSLALSRDLLVVGAFLESNVAPGSGAVHVYRRVAGTWSETILITADLVAPGRPSYDYFHLGRHVCLDGERMLVGAVHVRAPHTSGEYGAAYVVDLSGGSPTVEGALLPSLPAPTFASGTLYQSRVGRAVSLQGNLALVAAPGEQGGGDSIVLDRTGTGAAYLFARRGGVWQEVAKLRSGTPGSNEHAQAVALSAGHAYVQSGEGPGISFGHGRAYDYGDFSTAVMSVRPVAVAGADQIVSEFQAGPVQLDGSQSYDQDSSTLTYAWSQLPGGPTVTLSDATAAQPTFTVPEVPAGGATLTLQLVVSDGGNASDPDFVNVTVNNVNRVPMANIRAVAPVAEGTTNVLLDGIDSFDADGDDLTWLWSQVDTGLPVVLDSVPGYPSRRTFTAPQVGPAGAILVFRLHVSDGIVLSEPAEVQVIVTDINNPPVAVAGPAQTVPENTMVTLDGGTSTDPDGDAVGYEWTQLSGPAVTLSNPLAAQPTFTAPEVAGTVSLTFSLRVIDSRGLWSLQPATTIITVLDVTSPPSCGNARPSLDLLWPPNHKLVEVSILGVSQPGETLTITGVRQDEPINGLGDGDTGPDAVIQGNKVLLRAERSGTGNGRVYHVTFTLTGPNGSCSGTLTVGVPHNKGRAIVDGGPLHDSTR